MKIIYLEKGDWVGLSYWDNYVRQIDYFSSPDGWKIGFEIVYRLYISSQERALDHGDKLEGLIKSFKSAFGLADDHYKLDSVGHVATATVYWRVLWDQDAFNLKLLEECDKNLDKFAEQNGISIVVLETTIVPRSVEYISKNISGGYK
jgi:hypothetical protein